MSLDTKQKRGSVINISLPFRSWLAEPDGSFNTSDFLSLMYYSSAIAPLIVAQFDLICFTAELLGSPSFSSELFASPSITSELFLSSSFSSESVLEC